MWMRRLVAIEAGNKNCFATQGFQEQGRGKELVRLEEIGTAMISLEECCWEMQLQQQRQQLVVVPIRVRKDGWASDAMLYVSAIFSGLLFPHPPPSPFQLPCRPFAVLVELLWIWIIDMINVWWK